jgi:hypothetical protein
MRYFAVARLTGMLVVITALVTEHGHAGEVTVPVALQVDLLGRVVRFERNYASHGAQPAVVVVVAKSGLAAAVRAAAQVNAALSQVQNLGGRPAQPTPQTFSTAVALRSAARDAAVVYLMPGFSQAELKGIAAAFVDSNVLTVGTSNGDVESGAVLGFELEGSKPRIVLNLPQARAQHLDFSAQLLRLARVVQ